MKTIKNYNKFINENVKNDYNEMHVRLKELDNQSLDVYGKIQDLEHSELVPILSKVINTNNKELIQKVIDYKPKDLYLQNYAFLHQEIYELKNNPVSKSEITNYNVPYDELDKAYEKIKEQSDLSNSINKEATVLIQKIISTHDIKVFRKFIDVIQNLPNSKFYEEFYELMEDRNKNMNESNNDNTPDIEIIEKSESINDYELNGYDEEGVIGFVDIYDYNGKRYHIVQWYPHSEKGDKKEILKIEDI